MSIHDRLEEALDLLLRDSEDLTADVEARERERTAHTHSHRRGDGTQRSGKKRKREADITYEDFDKRLFKLVQAARSGGGMPRGDQYRLLHTPQIQPPPGTVQFEESTASFLDNLVYGAPYKLLIPAFRRSGWSGAADVSDSFAAFLHLPRTKGKSERKQASGPLLRRYYDREHRRQAQQYTELLMLHQEAGTRPARRWKSALDGLDVLEFSNVCEEDVTMGASMHARTERLSRHTREHAHDVNAWLQYTLHQQDVLLMSGGRVHPASLAAKQQSLLQSAMSHMPDSPELLAALACHVVRDLKNDEEEPDPVKYHIRQLKRLSKQYPASRVLWKELFGVLFQQGSGYSVTDIRACAVDAVRALSKHAERMRLTAPSMRTTASDLGAACLELWLAESAAVEALARHVEFELCCGHICKSMTLLRCIWTQPHRLRWFRAFFESEAELTGVKGAPCFTTWVDRQTIEWRAAESIDSPSDSEPETTAPPQSISEMEVDMEGPDMKQATKEGEEESQDEDMDDIDVLMLQERLGLTLEQQLEDLEAKGLSSEDLNRLLALEGQRCCADTGLEESQEGEQSGGEAEKVDDVMVKYDRIRHVLFWLAPEARKLSIRGCLQSIDILTDSLAGPYIPAVLPQSGQLSDDFHSFSRPMLLGEALGVLFHPYPSTTCAASMAQCPLWLCLNSFESRSVSSAGTAGSTATCGADADRSGDTHLISWFARSSGRHQLAVRLLRQLLAPNSILQNDAILLRSLLQVESSRKVLPDGQLESETVAGKRAYSAAKRWLSGQTESLEIWIGFAALEARRGRYSQALQALSTAMNGSVAHDESKQLCRWPLVLSAVLIEFAACGVPLHSSTAWSAAGHEAIVHAAGRSMHLLLWAAGGKGKARFVPLDKSTGPKGVAREAQTWKQRVHAAQVAYQSEMTGCLEVLQESGTAPGLCNVQCDAASAAVLCAMVFEVLGAVCGLLPQGGWDRAVRLFSHVTESMPGHVRAVRQECHAWACMICTLAALDRSTNPVRRHDLQLKLVRMFPSSSYLTHQLAVLQQSTCLQGRLRWSVSLLQRTAGPAAHPNLYLCSLIDLWRRHSDMPFVKGRFEWLLSAFSSQGGGRPRHKNSMGTVDVLELLSSVTRGTPAIQRFGKSGFISPYAVHSSRLKWCASSKQICDFFDPNQMPTFWLSYLSLVGAHEDSSAAYGLFYRAVNACGLCKGVWMKGLSEMSGSMKGTESSTLLETMMGREIPLKTLPAEVLLEQLDA